MLKGEEYKRYTGLSMTTPESRDKLNLTLTPNYSLTSCYPAVVAFRRVPTSYG